MLWCASHSIMKLFSQTEEEWYPMLAMLVSLPYVVFPTTSLKSDLWKTTLAFSR